MVRKVRLILGSLTVLVFGRLWSQCVCVASFITNKLPSSRVSETVCFVCLCVKALDSVTCPQNFNSTDTWGI